MVLAYRGRLVASEQGLERGGECEGQVIAPRSGDELDVDRKTFR